MESKTKHRILGILVIVGLVVISLPLFKNEREPQNTASLVKAPPFPDQNVQASANPSVDVATTDNTELKPLDDTKTVENNVNPQPDDTIKVSKPVAVSTGNEAKSSIVNQDAKPTTEVAKNNDSVPTPEGTTSVQQDANKASETNPNQQVALNNHETSNPTSSVIPVLHKPQVSKKKLAHAAPKNNLVKKKSLALNKKPLSNDGLISLKNPAWVIQIGSFSNKQNALLLVNKLRASGYKAFIQHVNDQAQRTRVYVGPENKETNIRALASQLEKEVHLKGLVIRYKPFAI